MVLSIRLPSRRKPEASMPVAESSEARQKFANAKAISSDMFFGRESDAEVSTAGKLLTHTSDDCYTYLFNCSLLGNKKDFLPDNESLFLFG